VGNRVFLRFVPWSGKDPVRDTLGCLRLIACREDTARALPDDLAEGAYEAWQKARRDIFDEWAFATDPANLQPKVRPALRAAADNIRKFPPPGVSQERLVYLLESLEAPWGARIERAIREAMEGLTGSAASASVTEKVKLLGLQPYRAPDPLPPIETDEIVLVCWMAVDSEAAK